MPKIGIVATARISILLAIGGLSFEWALPFRLMVATPVKFRFYFREIPDAQLRVTMI